MRKELSEAGLVTTPDQPTPRKPNFAGGPSFVVPDNSVFSPPCLACFSHVTSPFSNPLLLQSFALCPFFFFFFLLFFCKLGPSPSSPNPPLTLPPPRPLQPTSAHNMRQYIWQIINIYFCLIYLMLFLMVLSVLLLYAACMYLDSVLSGCRSEQCLKQ